MSELSDPLPLLDEEELEEVTTRALRANDTLPWGCVSSLGLGGVPMWSTGWRSLTVSRARLIRGLEGGWRVVGEVERLPPIVVYCIARVVLSTNVKIVFMIVVVNGRRWICGVADELERRRTCS